MKKKTSQSEKKNKPSGKKQPKTESASTQIPVTIVTGFLGSGKTTLLRKILSEPHGKRFAIIENEFGQESVDAELLTHLADEQIVEMNNGCLCCTVRGDLIRILNDLYVRRSKFDRIIIETTGLADPGPVSQSFFLDESIAQKYLLDAVITVIDAQNGNKQLSEHEVVQQQIGFADKILVSKRDLVNEETYQMLAHRLKTINARVKIIPISFGNIDFYELFDLYGFNLDAVLEIDPDFLNNTKESHTHAHQDNIRSFLFHSERPFDLKLLESFLSGIVRVHGPDLLRYKGILYVSDSKRQVIFQGVHMVMGTDLGKIWPTTEKPRTKMLFIGRNLPEDTLTKGLEGCLV